LACGASPAYNQPFYIHDALVSSYSSLNKDLWYTFPLGQPTPGTTICSVDVETLDTLIEQHDMAPLDVLSVDTEGTEEDVLLGLTLEKPRIVILESWFPDSPALRLMQNRGYKLVNTICHNYWFTL
jgi:FkbM family methyltransferase